jgi:hypothetical protein
MLLKTLLIISVLIYFPSAFEIKLKAAQVNGKQDGHAPHFSSLPWLLANTNRLAVIQKRLAMKFASVFPLKYAPLPFDFPVMRVMLQYHAAREKDEGLKWLRQLVHKTVTDSL